MNNVAVYCRLSKDDGSEESNSITSQKDVLLNYIKEQKWNLVDIYIDDGYSGTNFDRPSFQKMISDISDRNINIIITKDLSRLGRNYIQTGYYTEEYFPDNNIRYIALNDNYDTSDEDSNDFVPFKNIINEWYAKDISKKIRFTLDNQAKNGIQKRTCVPTFGYTFNKSGERIIDTEIAPIVVLIFDLYIELGSAVKVAYELNKRGIKNPSYYNAIKHNYNKDKVLEKEEYEHTIWNSSTIKGIIKNEVYIGKLITSKTKTKSFKNKKLIQNENKYVFEDKIEPIITKEVFEVVNRMRMRSRGSDIPVEENRFKGIVFCKLCGNKLRYDRILDKDTKEVKYHRYYCNRRGCCSGTIQKKNLDILVKTELTYLKEFILNKEEEFIKFADLVNKSKKVIVNDNSELERYINRCSELDNYIQKLFEAKVSNNVPESTYDMMMNKYSKEKKELEQLILDITKINQSNSKVNYKDKALLIVERFKTIDLDNLDTKAIRGIIDKIEVEPIKEEGKRIRKDFNIYFTYVNVDSVIKEFIEK